VNSRTKPLIFIVVGAVGLCSAIIVAKKDTAAGPRSNGAPQAVEKAKVLALTQNLRYGEIILLPGTEDQEAGQQPNARFIEWPKSLLPPGVISDPPAKTKPRQPHEGLSAEDSKRQAEEADRKAADLLKRVKDKKAHVRVRTAVSANVPVFASQVAHKLRPKGSRLCAVDVLREHMMQGLFSAPDTQVDLKKKGGSGYYDQLWMEGVPVFGLGRLTDSNDVVACEPAKQKVWVLLPDAENEALYRQQSKQLRALVREDEPLPAPRLAGRKSPIDETEARRAIDTARARQKLLDSAGGAAGEGRFDDVCKVLADCKEVKLVLDAQQRMFDAILKRAEAASRAKDYTGALAALKEFDSSCKSFEKAVALRRNIEKLAQEQARQDEYAALLQDVPTALESGNLPRVEKQLARLHIFALEQFVPQNAEHRKPGTAHADFAKRLKERQEDFEKDVAHFDRMIERGVVELARKTLAELRKKFPEHPAIKNKLEPRLQKAAGE
jgi:hypothetical protein